MIKFLIAFNILSALFGFFVFARTVTSKRKVNNSMSIDVGKKSGSRAPMWILYCSFPAEGFLGHDGESVEYVI